MSFYVTFRRVENVAVLELSGRMTKGEAWNLRKIIHDTVQAGSVRFVFHMAGLIYMDEDGLKEFYECRAIIPKGKVNDKLKLIQVSERLKSLFTYTCGRFLLENFEDEKAALASFNVTDP